MRIATVGMPAAHHPDTVEMRAILREKGLFAAEAALRNRLNETGVISVDTCAVLMQEYARLGAEAKISALLKAMEASGIALDRHCYNHLITLYAVTGKLQRMEKVHEEMRAHGHRESALTFKALLSGYTKGGVLSKAVRVFNDMAKAAFKPDVTV